MASAKPWKQSVERLQMTDQEYWRVLNRMVAAMDPDVLHETRQYRAKKLLDPWFGPKIVRGTITPVETSQRMTVIGQPVTPLSKGTPEYLTRLKELMLTWDGLEMPYDVKYRKAVKVLTQSSNKTSYWTSGQGHLDRQEFE